MISTAPGGDTRDHISRANDYWFRTMCRAMLYSTDLKTWESVDLPAASTMAQGRDNSSYNAIGSVHYYDGQYVCCACILGDYDSSLNLNLALLSAASPAGPWTIQKIRNPPGMANNLNDNGGHNYPDYDILRGNGVYVICATNKYITNDGTDGLMTSTDMQTWADGATDVGKIAYNPHNGYWYGKKSGKLVRTNTPAGAWAYFGDLALNTLPAFAFSAEKIFVTSGADQYAYAGINDETFTLKTCTGIGNAQTYVGSCGGAAIYADGTWIVAGKTQIYLSDDLSNGFETISTSYGVREFAADGDLVAGAIATTATGVDIAYHDFALNAKKIPNITPDGRSYAYIKALEE